MSSRPPPQDTYARLLSSSRGYPLWTPEPSNELLMQRREGLAIGDVGVVLEHGGVDVLFNLCLPADHPFHLRHGVPQGFTCINKSRLDIMTITNAEPPSYAIHSSSVTPAKTLGSSNDGSETRDSNALPYRFDLSTSEGAALVLPKGAERYDLLNEELFLEQARQHGAAWYNYAVNCRGRRISPDSLYLITGAHKTLAWSAAVFENASANGHHAAYLRQIERNDYPPMYTWEATGPCSLEWRVAPDTGPHVDHGIPNQTVFIRGFKIAIRNGLLGTRWVSVEADSPSTQSKNVKLSSIVPSGSPIPERLGGFLDAFFSSGERPQSNTHRGGYDGTQVKIQRVPDGPRPFHPSDTINRYLLENNPSANIAISHDSHWISLLENNSLTQEKLGDESSVQTALCQNYRVISRDGAVYLERKSSQETGCYPLFIFSPKATPAVLPQSSPSSSHFRPVNKLDFSPPQISVPFLEDNMKEPFSVPSSPLPRPKRCRWITNGLPCDTPVREQDILDHLYTSHAVRDEGDASHVQCQWDGCGRVFISHESFILHVLASHFYSSVLDTTISHPAWPASPISQPESSDIVHHIPSRTSDIAWSLYQIMNPTESIPGDLNLREYNCRWITHGQLCDAPVRAQDIPEHLADSHTIRDSNKTQAITCNWEGCDTLFDGSSLIRHIREQHLHSASEPDIMRHDGIPQPLYARMEPANANDFVDFDMPRQNPLQINDATKPITSHHQKEERYHCGWITNGLSCDAAILEEELLAHLGTAHGIRAPARTVVRCQWGDCDAMMRCEFLLRHIRERHLRHRRQSESDRRPGPLPSPLLRIPSLSPQKPSREPHIKPGGIV